jgi:poly(3-hydroxyalkanoate) synthetase
MEEMDGSNAFLWPALFAMETGRMALAATEHFTGWLKPGSELTATPPAWTTPNTVALELPSLRLRDFATKRSGTPTLLCPPFSLHGSTIADFAPGHSLVEALRAAGVGRLFLAEWRSATAETRSLSIDSLLADLNVAVDELGGRVNLVGLCQGGWMALAYSARFPAKVARLVIAGAPIDTSVGETAAVKAARTMPFSVFRDIVDLGRGRLLGEHALCYWDARTLDTATIQKDLQLRRAPPRELEERFRNWHRWTVDLPGTFYLQVVQWLFVENRLATGKFVALGHALDLSKLTVPTFLVAGRQDTVVALPQLMAAERLIGTRPDAVASLVIDSEHLGLFMGKRTLKEAWPGVARWLSSPPVGRQSRSQSRKT